MPSVPFWAWIIVALVGGAGGIAYIIQRMRAGQKAEIENLGLKQQTYSQAESTAFEEEARAKRDKELSKTGKPTIQEWKLVALLAILIGLSGCTGSTKVTGYGRSWMPEIQAPARLEYTEKEAEILNDFGAANPELARKIVNQSNAMRAQIDAYNAFRWRNNRKCLESIGVEEAEALKLLGPSPEPEPD